MTLQVINPYNHETVCELPYDTNEQLRVKLDTAKKAFEEWRGNSLEKRSIAVSKGLEYFRINSEEIAQDITRQMGKPLSEARSEVRTFFDRAEHMMSIAKEVLKAEILSHKEGVHRRIEHVPLGVVFNISAWNYPLLLTVNVVIPALLSGNTVILKHSAKTPLCGLHFEKAFLPVGIPGLVTNVIVSHEQTSQLIQDPAINHVVFTGSVEGGHKIYQDASKRFIDVGLELGGKDPAYIAEDADMEFTVANVIEGACYNAGQSCCAVERIYVHHNNYDEFIDRAQAIIKQYRPGDPFDKKTNIGPLASPSALDFLEGQVKDAVERGARLLTGGKRLEKLKGNFFPPTLLVDVPNTADVMQEESFGPLIPVQKVHDDREALKQMNDTHFGLTASVWTRSRDTAEYFARNLNTGTIYQNRCDYLDPELPWTGVLDSGKGSSLSRYGFYHLTRRKSIHFREI